MVSVSIERTDGDWSPSQNSGCRSRRDSSLSLRDLFRGQVRSISTRSTGRRRRRTCGHSRHRSRSGSDNNNRCTFKHYAEYIHRGVRAVNTSDMRAEAARRPPYSRRDREALGHFMRYVLPRLEHVSVETAERWWGGSVVLFGDGLFSDAADDGFRRLFSLLVRMELIPSPGELEPCPNELRRLIAGDAEGGLRPWW